MVPAVGTHSSPWDHQSSRFRTPDPKAEVAAVAYLCPTPPTWIPSTGSPTGVSSSRVPADSAHGSLVLGLMRGGSEEPQRAGRGAHPPLACSTSRFGLPHSHHTFSVLLHTPHPTSLPACLQISLGGQPVAVCPLNLSFYS